MTIIGEKKDISSYISPYVHQHPHLFQSTISAINFDIVNYINNVDHTHQCISGKPKAHHMTFIHQDIHRRYAHPPQRPHRSPIEPLEIGYKSEDEFGDSPHVEASTEMSQEELHFPMASQPLRHLCGHLHHLEGAAHHFFQSFVDIINIGIVNQTIHQRDHPYPVREGLLHPLRHPHHRVQHLPEFGTHHLLSTSRRSNQQLDIMVIKEEEVDIIKRNDREVITTQIIKITMQEHPGNSSHIMSDNYKSIYFKRCIIAGEFIMDSDFYIVFIYLQNSFTKELIIQSKIILEEITQVGSDITLPIENCRRIQYVYTIYFIDLVNTIKEKDKDHQEKTPDLFKKEHNRGHHGVHHLRKDLIKFDTVLDILDIIGHFAQRGHQPSTTIKLDSITEYHLLDSSSVNGPNRLSVPSAINIDIIVNVEKFIRITHLWYTHHINILNMNDIIRSEPSAEYHLLDYISISMSSYPSPTCIKAELINRDIFAEYHLLDYICINGPNYISVIRVINLDFNTKADRFIRTICPSHINLFITQDMVIMTEVFIDTYKVELCLPHHHGNVSHISYDFVISSCSIDTLVKKKKKDINIIFMPYINLLLNNLDINIKAERFIRNHHSYIHLVRSITREVPSEDHRLVLKSHHGTSSRNTSEEHITYVQHTMVKQEDIQVYRILTILCVLVSKYLILSESIIDNHFHIILVALHQWKALDITHSCPSGNGAHRSHLIEWKETNHSTIIKNIDYVEITHQKKVCFIYSHDIYVSQGRVVINDINADLSSHSITQNISIIDTIIYDTTTHHISIYNRFGTIIVEDIDLSSMTEEYILITFVDFMKYSSEHIDIILDNVIIEKKDLNIRTDPFIIIVLEFIITNNVQQLSNILQRDNVILDYIIMTNVYNIHHLFISYLDISNHNLTMAGLMDHHIDQFITNLVIIIQLHELQQLNIIHFINCASDIHCRVEFNIEHLINHLESYITYHLKIGFIFDITLTITYLNQFIMEPYNTILETEVIRNVNSDETSYTDIMIFESYITTGVTVILVYLIISIVKIINNINKTRIITIVEDKANIKLIMLIYVFILKRETKPS